MRTPHIEFVCSKIYNERWKQWMKYHRIAKIKNISSAEKSLKLLEDYKRRIEKIWRRYEKKILEEISKSTGLRWEGEFITCYIVEKCVSFSSPLTMSVQAYSNFIDFLTHEMIHIILDQEKNLRRTKKAWRYFNKNYKDENTRTIEHILISAVHANIFEKFFDKERMEKHISMLNYSPFYARAWQIVQQEGYENIIREFRKRIK